MGCSLNQAARRIAERYGRAHETVRHVSEEERGSRGRRVWGARAAVGRERELMARAHWLGIEPRKSRRG
jgi:hypothetical protein